MKPHPLHPHGQAAQRRLAVEVLPPPGRAAVRL
jgi:hypothetical protein